MKLYGFGSNASGQLGIGHNEDTSVPQLCHPVADEEWPSSIRTIKAGGNHTLVLLESGQLYISGSIPGGKTGMGLESDLISHFHEVPHSMFGRSKVKLCSASWEASVIVTDDNDIYTFGVGLKGELGSGNEGSHPQNKLERFGPLGEQIIDLSSGMAHTLVIFSNGDVYGWGNGRKGQLGQPAEILSEPRAAQTFPIS
ncbi:MAG: hypothetical protein L6R40_000716 [Gallowayella cf. fulva]|nr:MAG: hypothetical protein L6R40_000716 [Xanthomendoza cf. fulva]